MHQDPNGPYREQSKAAKGGQKRPRSAGAAPYDSRLRLPRFSESRFTDHGSRSFPIGSLGKALGRLRRAVRQAIRQNPYVRIWARYVWPRYATIITKVFGGYSLVSPGSSWSHL